MSGGCGKSGDHRSGNADGDGSAEWRTGTVHVHPVYEHELCGDAGLTDSHLSDAVRGRL